MSGLFTLVGFAAKLVAIEHDLTEVGPAIVARACEMVANAAKEALGTYEFGWISLRPETIAHKMRGDSPLLETGELRDSIQWNSSGLLGHVGSNLDRAVWQELGTSRGIPPRPFLGAAAAQQEALIYKMAGRAVAGVLRGEGLASAEMRELLHVLHLVKHAVKELRELIPEDPDKNKGRR